MNEADEIRRGTILHADLDAFYASVEQLLDPSLRGKPIAVGGGVVLAASYEAKAFGVRGGMSGQRALELCPQLQFVEGKFGEYQRLGDAAIELLGDFTPLVERLSIDEAFADVTGCERLFGPPVEIAKEIRRRARVELGLPISVSVARTKHLAKIASQVAKPDGLVVVDSAAELAFLHGLPVELMWGVGPVTKAQLADAGLITIGQLAHVQPWRLENLLGSALGQKLSALAWNRDPREIKTQRQDRHPASRQIATGTNSDGARALCGYALSHPLGNAAGANFGNENARRGRRGTGPCGPGGSPAREDHLVAGNFSFELGGASDRAARAADWIGGRGLSPWLQAG